MLELAIFQIASAHCDSGCSKSICAARASSVTKARPHILHTMRLYHLSLMLPEWQQQQQQQRQTVNNDLKLLAEIEGCV